MKVTDRFRVDGRVAIVTGAGRGLGAAIAVALAEAGADVVIAARTAAQLDEVAGAVEAAGRRAVPVAADLSDLDATAALADTAHDAFGRIDIVVNNVGGAMPRAFLHTSPRALADAFAFNVGTAHALTRAAVPKMLAGDGGAVVNISSAMARFSARGFLAYGTAKAALSQYSRLAAADLAPRIRVNAVAVGAAARRPSTSSMTDDGLRTQMEAATPLHRIADPAEIAATVVWLASPAGAYVTGKVIEVDGGLDRPNLELGLPDL